MLNETNNLENLINIDVETLKQSFNILSRKKILDENSVLTTEDKEHILSYGNQSELWGFYKLSESKASSFTEMIMQGF
jgi:hypothetical protein